MRNFIVILFLLIGGFCFWQITDLLRDGILPLWAYLTLCLGGMSLVGFVGWLKIKPAVDEATTEIEDV